jgi:hypothetical protein
MLRTISKYFPGRRGCGEGQDSQSIHVSKTKIASAPVVSVAFGLSRSSFFRTASRDSKLFFMAESGDALGGQVTLNFVLNFPLNELRQNISNIMYFGRFARYSHSQFFGSATVFCNLPRPTSARRLRHIQFTWRFILSIVPKLRNLPLLHPSICIRSHRSKLYCYAWLGFGVGIPSATVQLVSPCRVDVGCNRPFLGL